MSRCQPCARVGVRRGRGLFGATHSIATRMRQASAAGMACVWPRTEAPPKATLHHELSIGLQLSCDEPLLPPCHALGYTRKRRKSDAPSRAELVAAFMRQAPAAAMLRVWSHTEAPHKATRGHELRIRMKPACGKTLPPPCHASDHAWQRRPKQRITTSCAFDCSSHAASLRCRHAMRMITHGSAGQGAAAADMSGS